tara:strand:+ start:373 stop:576 length:204 start_codon:yes stop_codon:yes gene_type:complete
MHKSPQQQLADLLALRVQRREEFREVKSWYGRDENVPETILNEQRETELMINKEIARLRVKIEGASQ